MNDSAKQATKDLYTDGYGKKATRLVFEYDGIIDAGIGINQSSVESIIREAIAPHMDLMRRMARVLKQVDTLLEWDEVPELLADYRRMQESEETNDQTDDK